MWPPLNGHMDFTAPPLVGPHTKKRPGLPRKGRILEIEAGFCHVKFCHKIKGLEHILGRSRGEPFSKMWPPLNGHMDSHSSSFSGATHKERPGLPVRAES